MIPEVCEGVIPRYTSIFFKCLKSSNESCTCIWYKVYVNDDIKHFWERTMCGLVK